MTQVVYFCNCN